MAMRGAFPLGKRADRPSHATLCAHLLIECMRLRTVQRASHNTDIINDARRASLGLPTMSDLVGCLTDRCRGKAAQSSKPIVKWHARHLRWWRNAWPNEATQSYLRSIDRSTVGIE
jgi:hypothetical protein